MSKMLLTMLFMLMLVNTPIDLVFHDDTLSDLQTNHSSMEALSGISENIGELIFTDDFQSAPLGFNGTQWNLIAINNPSLAWTNRDSLDLWGEKFKTTLLRSNRMFGPGLIADVNVSFTLGSCYFCIGWCDEWRDQENEWIASGRACRNGVFIDCWDGELFLVTYAQGERTVAHVESSDLSGWHNLKIEWTESLVRLEIDATTIDFVSRTIPQSQLVFTFMMSGHHEAVEAGRLSIESLRVYQYNRISTPHDPEIVLLWPTNNSIVYPCSVIDFEVRGAESNLTFSWGQARTYEVGSPWDIQVPSIIYGPPLTLPITLPLIVTAIGAEGHQSTYTFTFRIDEQDHRFGVWFIPDEPTIDGFIDLNEEKSASHFEFGFRSESNQEVRVNMLAGYTSDSIYMAIESPIPDSYHSRSTLLLDGDADQIWSDGGQDLKVSIASPNADAIYSCISGLNEELVAEVICDALENDGVVTYEYLIPLACLNINENDDVAFRLQLSHGGYNLNFPDKEDLVILYSLGVAVHNPNELESAVVSGIVIFCAGIIGLAIYAARKETYYIDSITNDERIERIKTLLLSYHRIDLPRLSRMMDLESDVVESLVEELITQGFPVYNNANGEFVRFRKALKQNK